MLNSDERKWCWCEQGSEEAFGPFPSRSATISDAKVQLRDKLGCTEDEMEIEVGRVNPAYPDEHSGVLDVEDLLERMDDHASDNGFGFADTEIFAVKDLGAAQESLDALMRLWAKAYVTTETWAMADLETVRVRLQEERE